MIFSLLSVSHRGAQCFSVLGLNSSAKISGAQVATLNLCWIMSLCEKNGKIEPYYPAMQQFKSSFIEMTKTNIADTVAASTVDDRGYLQIIPSAASQSVSLRATLTSDQKQSKKDT